MRETSQLLLSALLLIALGLGAGCGRKANDAKISSDIHSKFSQDSGLSNKQLTVASDDGVVTLRGVVDNDAQREAASRQAASIAGVKQVINNLEVGSAAEAGTAAPVETPVSSKPVPGTAHLEKTARVERRSRTRASADPDNRSAHDSSKNQTSDDNNPPANTAPSTSEVASNIPETSQAPPPPPAPKRLIIDQGTQLTIRLVDAIDSEKSHSGDTFHATLNAPLTSDGEQAVPAGTELVGHLVEVKSAGKFAGQSEVVLQLDSLTSAGKTYSLQTDQYRKTGRSRGKNTAEKVGGGAIIGGIIGAIAGGGKGAAIGSAAGAGIGGGVQAATKSDQIQLPSETILNFTLQAPITVVQALNVDANRPRLADSPR